jgi:hypothetical protein
MKWGPFGGSRQSLEVEFYEVRIAPVRYGRTSDGHMVELVVAKIVKVRA